MLDQRRRRWADVVQMLCKCFVPTGSKLSVDQAYVIKLVVVYDNIRSSLGQKHVVMKSGQFS